MCRDETVQNTFISPEVHILYRAGFVTGSPDYDMLV